MGPTPQSPTRAGVGHVWDDQVDQGEVVAVGRQTRVPPGWLADGVLAGHDTCCAPWGDRPARTAELTAHRSAEPGSEEPRVQLFLAA